MFFQLDDWVLCRIYKKKGPERPLEQREENIINNAQNIPSENQNVAELQSMNIPRTFSLAHLWELESLGSISHLLDDHNANYENNTGIETGATMGIMSQSSTSYQGTRLREPHSIKFEENYQNNNLNQPNFYNSMFEF